MTPRYPGHDPEAAVQQLGWRGLERFDGGDPVVPLGPGAKSLAPPPPVDLRPELPANRPGGRTIAVDSPFSRHALNSRDRESLAVKAIAAFPKKRKRGWKPAPSRLDKAVCPHSEGWSRNGKGTTPGTEREKCRACGLNRQRPKGKR